MPPKEQKRPPSSATEDTEDYVRLKELTTGGWACTSCQGSCFKKLKTAHKHVSRDHPGKKSRSKPFKIGIKLQEHKKRVSVQTSRRHLVKKRALQLLSGNTVDNDTSSAASSAKQAVAQLNSGGLNYGTYTCTGLVRRGDSIQRCRTKAIAGALGDDSNRR